MRIARSLGALVAGGVVAIGEVALFPMLFLPAIGRIPAAVVEAHGTMIATLAYATMTVLVAVSAGVVVGRVAPDRPAAHALALAGLLTLGGLVISGRASLPHGWQVAGLGLQLLLLCVVARFTSSRRAHRPQVIGPA